MGNPDFKNPVKSSPEELRKTMQKLKVVYDWPKIDLNSDKECEDRISLYFDYSMQNGLRPTIEGLALAVGIDRRTVWDWENKVSRSQPGSSRSDIIKKAKDYIAFLMSNEVMNGNINPVTWIFYAKNYFGMKDTQDINIIPTNPNDAQVPIDDIKKLLQDQHDKSYVVDTDSKDIN
jgi:hypothetical protein